MAWHLFDTKPLFTWTVADLLSMKFQSQYQTETFQEYAFEMFLYKTVSKSFIQRGIYAGAWL